MVLREILGRADFFPSVSARRAGQLEDMHSENQGEIHHPEGHAPRQDGHQQQQQRPLRKKSLVMSLMDPSSIAAMTIAASKHCHVNTPPQRTPTSTAAAAAAVTRRLEEDKHGSHQYHHQEGAEKGDTFHHGPAAKLRRISMAHPVHGSASPYPPKTCEGGGGAQEAEDAGAGEGGGKKKGHSLLRTVHKVSIPLCPPRAHIPCS